ncbi:MAG: M1 family metallopeptidase [Gemmatimonadota bacterium]
MTPRYRGIPLIVSLLGPVALACTETAKQATPDPVVVQDVHSYARPAEARVEHVSLRLVPDFTARRIGGTARLAIQRTAGADSIILDIRDLAIRRVTDSKGDTLVYHVGASDSIRGAPLVIRLPASGDTIVIEYETSPNAAAVQWLDPAQTAGKKLPFLFTQGQAILTRTWVPTQDSPGIRQTYDATVLVPTGMRAVMSAEMLTPDGEPADDANRTAYRFRLTNPIPPYLIALAVGDLAFRKIGENTGVWAEPSVVDKAANEFVEVDQMIAAAERLYGPYRWGRYDILVLPPSFPFGGMENPRLTFATPTVLAGDRSLVSLVAHELAHSWSGNLVTNATWDDFWLNEGFTTYIESRLMEELRGKPYADMLRQLGRQNLESTVADLGPTAPDTRLHLDLTGRDPDAGMTDIAYEKGAAFLQTVESVVGREKLDTFLRGYFDNNAFRPMTSERFVQYLNENLFAGDESLASRVRVNEWINQPGLPDNVPPVRAEAFDQVDRAVAAFRSGTLPNKDQTDKWSTHEWLHFLRQLPDTMSSAQLQSLDRAFNLTQSGNSEVLFQWLRTAIRNHYEPALPALERFLTAQGRRKFVAPLYTDLMATDWGKALAMQIYRKARPTYHSVAVGTIDGIVGWR